MVSRAMNEVIPGKGRGFCSGPKVGRRGTTGEEGRLIGVLERSGPLAAHIIRNSPRKGLNHKERIHPSDINPGFKPTRANEKNLKGLP
jgi:hypothetical protein